jgi:hypothetical protein
MLTLTAADQPSSWRGWVESRRYAGARYAYRVYVEFAPERYHTFEIESENGGYPERSTVGVTLLQKPIALLFR